MVRRCEDPWYDVVRAYGTTLWGLMVRRCEDPWYDVVRAYGTTL